MSSIVTGRLTICCLLCWAVVFPRQSTAQDAGRRFLDEYSKAVPQLEEFYTHLTMTVTETQYAKDGKSVENVITRRFLSNGQLLGIRRSYSSGALPDATIARPDMTFHVKKQGSEGQFIADEVNVVKYSGIAERIRLGAKLPFAPFCIYESTILQYLTSKEVAIVDVSESGDEGMRRVRVKTTATYQSPKGPLEDHTVFEFAPDRRWVLLEYTRGGAVENSTQRHCRVTYDFESSKFPVAQSVEYWKSKGDEVTPQMSLVASEVELSPAAESEFTLAAFGIPEIMPTPGRRAPTINGLILFNIALALCGLAYWVRHQAKRRSAGSHRETNDAGS